MGAFPARALLAAILLLRPAAARVEAARVEQERLGKQAFDKGQEALRKGDVAGALRFYRTALTHAPDNQAYRRQRAATLRAHGGSVLQQLQGAAIDGDAAARATDDPEAALGSRRIFDVEGTKPPATAPAVAKEESVSAALVRILRLDVDLRNPAHADVVGALGKVEYMLKYNLEARVRESWPEDRAALQQRVTELNVALAARGVPAVPTERVEAAYNKYRLDLKVKPR